MLSRFPLIIFYARKSSCEYVHSVRIELTKLILVGTRITYQATGEYMYHKNGEKTKQYSYTVQMLPLTEKLVEGKTLFPQRAGIVTVAPGHCRGRCCGDAGSSSDSFLEEERSLSVSPELARLDVLKRVT